MNGCVINITNNYINYCLIVDYLSDEVPVKIHLETFSPTIPLDSKNSALPVVIFNFTVTNTGAKEAKVGHKADFI